MKGFEILLQGVGERLINETEILRAFQLCTFLIFTGTLFMSHYRDLIQDVQYANQEKTDFFPIFLLDWTNAWSRALLGLWNSWWNKATLKVYFIWTVMSRLALKSMKYWRLWIVWKYCFEGRGTWSEFRTHRTPNWTESSCLPCFVF